jgi:hypothetical protein
MRKSEDKSASDSAWAMEEEGTCLPAALADRGTETAAWRDAAADLDERVDKPATMWPRPRARGDDLGEAARGGVVVVGLQPEARRQLWACGLWPLLHHDHEFTTHELRCGRAGGHHLSL